MIQSFVLGSLDRVTHTFHSLYQSDLRKLRKASARILIHCEIGPFYVKTVTESEELRQALRLRYEVSQELGAVHPSTKIDEYDFQSDHFVIVEKKTEKVVGTFRLQNSQFSQSLQATRKFDLALHMTPPETILELGCACIHKDYRRGMASSLIWRGVAEYMVQSRALAVIGCASITAKDARSAALVHRYFEVKEKLCPDNSADVKFDSIIPYLETWRRLFRRELTADEMSKAEALVPFVCRGILKNGGRIISKPAMDKRTKNIEFLTMLPREDLNRTQWKKFLAHFAVASSL